jgi:PAS domain S-box-containing protein
MFTKSTIGLAHVATNATIIKVNEALCKIWERSEDVILGDGFTWKDITDERDLAKDEKLLAELHNKLIPSYTLTKRYLMPDGSKKYCEIQVYRVEDSYGDILHYVATVQEVGLDPKLHKILVRIDESLEDLENARE